MKTSTFNKIYKIAFHIWGALFVLLLFYGLYYAYVVFVYNEPIITKYHTIENTEVIYSEKECEMDSAITEFEKVNRIDSLWYIDWSDNGKWKLEFEAFGKINGLKAKVEVEEYFESLSEMTAFMEDYNQNY